MDYFYLLFCRHPSTPDLRREVYGFKLLQANTNEYILLQSPHGDNLLPSAANISCVRSNQQDNSPNECGVFLSQCDTASAT